MKKTALMALITVLIGLAFAASPALAQVNPEIANCEEIKDEATQTQADFCAAHVGCKMVMGIHKTCAKIKSFLDRLKEKVGEGAKTIFGRRKDVDASQVFEAYRDVEIEDASHKKYRDKLNSEKWNSLAATNQNFRASMQRENLIEPSKATDNGELRSVVYSEQDSDSSSRKIIFNQSNKGILSVYSMKTSAGAPVFYENISSQGTIALYGRMGGDPVGEKRFLVDTLKDGMYEGVLLPSADGDKEGEKIFKGTWTRRDGSSFTGELENFKRKQGTEYGPDGKKREEGLFRGDVLVEGKRYSSDGNVLASITTLSDERRAAQAKIEREQAEVRRLAQEERQREQKAKQDEETKVARMNPGELFAYADELSARGKTDEARKIYRTLLTKFPNHALAANAANALASRGNESPSQNKDISGTKSENSPKGDCEQLLNKKNDEFAAINKRTLTGMTEGFERVMWMTSQMIKVIDLNCPNQKTYTQLRAELKAAFDQAKQNCAQVNTGQCTPQPH